MKPTITFPAGTNYVRIGDIHKLLLEVSGDPFVVLAYEDELKGAIRDGEITPLNGLTHRRHKFPRGAALNLADITVEEFRLFAVGFQINVAIEEAAPNMPEKVGDGETANEAKQAASVSAIEGIDKRGVASAFSDLHFDHDKWLKNLATPPNWLKECRIEKGSKKASATWNPVLIAIGLYDKEVSLKKLDAVFVGLKKWGAEWQEKTTLLR